MADMVADGAAQPLEHPTVEQRAARGRQGRRSCPRTSHAELPVEAARAHPVSILEEQALARIPELVPIRHGRMSASPFAFYRGAAAIMAADLARTPTTSLRTQLCGDMHLANFGMYGAPDRTLVFDINDFDETLPGPFEWDVKRMAASFVVAGRDRGFTPKEIRAAASASVAAYRVSTARFAGMPNLDLWYSRVSEEDILSYARQMASARAARRAEQSMRKARSKTSYTAARKLTQVVGGRRRFVEQPPLISRAAIGDEVRGNMHEGLRRYRRSLPNDRKRLLERYEFVDIALKVVGVGSVGTRAVVMLMQGRDEEDLLVLQIKEAQRSVLESHLPRSTFRQPGQRVVEGQRFMQAASDIFLGWVSSIDGAAHYYVRQLHDMKGSVDVSVVRPEGLVAYARLCGYTLARAHARGGDAVAVSAYLGKSDAFDRAVLEFAERYADLNESDYRLMVEAIRDGRLAATTGV